MSQLFTPPASRPPPPLTQTDDRLSNWLAGRFGEPAQRRGALFERPSGVSSPPKWKWPRSDSSELEEAIQAAEDRSKSWSKLAPDERFDRLVRAAAQLERQADPLGTLGRKMRLGGDELATMARRVRLRFESAEDERPEGRGLCFLRLDAREFFKGFGSLLELAASGQTVVALGDSRLPEVAHSFAAALDRSEALKGWEGVVSILQDDRRTVLREALDHSAFTSCVFHGDDSEWQELREEDSGAGPPRDHVRTALTTCVVREGEDPERAARGLARRAFGRVEALSGFAAGRVGRVVCHERRFSALTTALLQALEEGPSPISLPEGFDTPPDLTALEPGLTAHLDGLRTLALDEGATVLVGGDLRRAQGRPGGSQRSLTSAILSPATTPWATVVTNVEERMRTVRPRRPAPLLCLLRARSDRAAEETARRLDLPPGE